MRERLKRIAPLRAAVIGLSDSFARGRVRQLWHWSTRGHFVRTRRVQAWLTEASDAPRALQVGGGRHVIREPGWANGDLIRGDIYLDAGKRMPIPSGSLDFVFTEQFFEHLSLEQGAVFLAECHRVLRPGGVLRQSTPDLQGLLSVYQDDNEHVSLDAAVERHRVSHCSRDTTGVFGGARFLNDNFRLWGHQFIYDRRTLEDVTKRAGFSELSWESFGASSIEFLQGRERHVGQPWLAQAYVQVLEARK